MSCAKYALSEIQTAWIIRQGVMHNHL